MSTDQGTPVDPDPDTSQPCLRLWLSYLSMPTAVALLIAATPPGQWFYRNRFRWPVSNRISWCIKELPSLLIPLWHLWGQPGPLLRPPLLPLVLFATHYCQRALVYPWRVSADSTEPAPYVLMATAFTAWNGQMQSAAAVHCPADGGAAYTARHLAGAAIFAVGAAVNIDSDQRLLSLRKPGGPRYTIPHGGMLELVTAANYLGEIVEWWGYALVSWTPPALGFAVFTTVYLAGCACDLHNRNLARFGDAYPRHRRRLVPFVF